MPCRYLLGGLKTYYVVTVSPVVGGKELEVNVGGNVGLQGVSWDKAAPSLPRAISPSQRAMLPTLTLLPAPLLPVMGML